LIGESQAEVLTSHVGATWLWSLASLSLLVLSIVALSGPGRLDIDDGEARYEVAKAIAVRGEISVERADFWWTMIPGRGGRVYSAYRLPHSLLGAPAIWLADLTGPHSEARRRFFFSLLGAVAAGGLAVLYAVWFRWQGHSARSAIAWALGGVLANPSWYYATSTFDDILGTFFGVAAILAGRRAASGGRAAAIASGTLLAVAFHCKQPLGIFVLIVCGAVWGMPQPRRERLARILCVLVPLGLGYGVYRALDWYRFPPETQAEMAKILAKVIPVHPGDPIANVASLAVSPGTALLLYCPPALLGLVGLGALKREARWSFWGWVGALSIFTGFLCSLSIVKGDMAWGPRYFTPIFGALWLLAPPGARRLSPRSSRLLVGAGVLVQLLALRVDPIRLYAERAVPVAFYFDAPWSYFDPKLSHLLNRPREIAEILADPGPKRPRFSPSAEATSFLWSRANIELASGRALLERYGVFRSLRPWWSSHRWMPSAERPVDLRWTLILQLSMTVVGAVLLAWSLRLQEDRFAPGW
jgi:hypothetical protein